MIRDDEINRLIKYAQGLGLKVSFVSDYKDAAGWVIDGSEILINPKRCKSKLETILTLIHELAHHLWFIHQKNRKPDLKFEEAIDRQNCENSNTTPKNLRYKIFKVEQSSAEWWETIYKETNMKFDIKKLYSQREYDVWQYQYFYEEGKFPNRKISRPKWKEIKEKYK